MSDDGSRLFFSSPDALAGVAGGSVKVFEYEDGTIQLISGAEAGGEAVFLDASASGNDVFFATRERLAATDTDQLIDVYDARVDGGLPAAGPAAVLRRRHVPGTTDRAAVAGYAAIRLIQWPRQSGRVAVQAAREADAQAAPGSVP